MRFFRIRFLHELTLHCDFGRWRKLIPGGHEIAGSYRQLIFQKSWDALFYVVQNFLVYFGTPFKMHYFAFLTQYRANKLLNGLSCFDELLLRPSLIARRFFCAFGVAHSYWAIRLYRRRKSWSAFRAAGPFSA